MAAREARGLEDHYADNIAGFGYTIGIGQMEDAVWEPIADPAWIGMNYRSYLGIKPLELELGAGFGYDSQGGGSQPLSRSRFYEFDLGLAVSLPLSKERSIIEPYGGAGLALLWGRSDLEGGGGVTESDDADSGYYVHGGVRIYVHDRQYVAIDWRWLGGVDLDLGFGNVSAEQSTVSVGFGISF